MAAEEAENRKQGQLRRQREQGDAERTPLQERDLNLPQGNQGPQHPRQAPAPQPQHQEGSPAPPILHVARRPLLPHFSVVHHLKPFTAKCSKCGAKHWLEERASKSSMQNAEFSMCCARGKVSLPAPVYPPIKLARYLLDQTQGERSFFLFCFVRRMAAHS